MFMKNKVSIKSLGNRVEKEFATHMYDRGWWVHLLNDKVNGQPFDVIMAKDESVWFLDVKNVQDKDYFLHSRIEDNQINSMKMLINRGMINVGFVIKFNDGWYLLKYINIDFDANKTYKKDCIQIFKQ